MIDLTRLDRDEIAGIDEAGRGFLASQHRIAAAADGIIGLVLGGTTPGTIAEGPHYPLGEVYDPLSHAQYFYHRHATRGTGRNPAPPHEHGHFHTFMRPRGMPPGTRPLVMPELAIADAPSRPLDSMSPPAPQPNQGDDNDKFSHLVAVALDASGAPTRLFTTNRWVTGETWYVAEDVIAMLDGFTAGLSRPEAPLGQWLAALLRLYHPDIADLLRARDAAVMGWRRRRRGKIHVFEDQRLEIPSSIEIDPDDRLRHLGAMRGWANSVPNPT
ncbi:MAG: DUF6969 family protein [Stellaceae bacterium]